MANVITPRAREVLRRLATVSPVSTVVWRGRTGSRNLLVGKRFRVINTGVIRVRKFDRVRFGTAFFGFIDDRVPSLIRNRGRIDFNGPISIGAGAQWDIGPGAELRVGGDTYFSPFVRLVVTRQVMIGSRCAIGWNVQILDSDFHLHGSRGELSGAVADRNLPVVVGDGVWLGSHVSLLKGVEIASGCIVAAHSVVTRSVTEQNCLIAGNPARIVKRDIEWK